MKRYRLKKDLPTHKAGDEFVLNCHGLVIVNYGEEGELVYSASTLDKFPNILGEWFEEIKEPLIKDERIRKAVRAMANITGVSTLYYSYYHHQYTGIGEVHFSDMKGQTLVLKSEKLRAKDLDSYTIDELCGEEEE